MSCKMKKYNNKAAFYHCDGYSVNSKLKNKVVKMLIHFGGVFGVNLKTQNSKIAHIFQLLCDKNLLVGTLIEGINRASMDVSDDTLKKFCTYDKGNVAIPSPL